MTSIILDVILIAFLAAGIVYAVKLSKQLALLRSSRTDMERFVFEFNTSVTRAEASIHGLKQAARSSGDDLEQLMEKSQKMMDELTFLVESADQIASRLSQSATQASTGGTTHTPDPAHTPTPQAVAAKHAKHAKAAPTKEQGATASKAEKDLIQALEKLG